MAQHQTLRVVRYTPEGELESNEQVDLISIDQAGVEDFRSRLKQLSGDLDLPLEEPLPGTDQIGGGTVRICSDQQKAAYTVYYHDEEAVFASLLLSGQDDEAEFELMQVFRFLLLDTSEDDDPDDEAIDEILSADEFNFEEVEDRPVAYQIRLREGDAQLESICDHMAALDQQVAVAFFGLQVKT